MRTRPVAKVEGHILRSVPQPSASLLAREALARAGFGQRPCRLEFGDRPSRHGDILALSPAAPPPWASARRCR